MGKVSPFKSSPKLVILVEDQADMRALAAELLRDAGFVVIETEDAGQAIRTLRLLAFTVDVLFTDLQMPGEMSGLALIQHVHKTWPRISLLLASAHAPPKPLDLPPASRFLVKPYPPEHLISQVRELAMMVPVGVEPRPGQLLTLQAG